jgi:5-aminopentanamidase
MEELAEIAKAYSMALCVPLPEKEGDAVYNSAALFDCTGELVFMYRKTHLWSTYEKVSFLSTLQA